MDDFKCTCPHCEDISNHEVVRGNGKDSSGPVYKCNMCEKLFTIPDTCSSLSIPIPYNGNIEEVE